MTDDRVNTNWRQAVEALPSNSAVVVRAWTAAMRQERASAIAPIARRKGIKLIIADDLALAIRQRADGVHLPEARSHLALAIRRTWPRLLVTAAAHGPKGLVKARFGKANAAVLSSAFASQSHPERQAQPLVQWGLARHCTSMHVVALGGIDATTASKVISLKANGLALISAWLTTDATL